MGTSLEIREWCVSPLALVTLPLSLNLLFCMEIFPLLETLTDVYASSPPQDLRLCSFRQNLSDSSPPLQCLGVVLGTLGVRIQESPVSCSFHTSLAQHEAKPTGC